jgi:hypothetical protein
VASAALRLFQDTVSRLLSAADGYVVELVDGLCLAAFRSAADALLWALRCNKQLLAAPWDEALLEHELCEVGEPEGSWRCMRGPLGGDMVHGACHSHSHACISI